MIRQRAADEHESNQNVVGIPVWIRIFVYTKTTFLEL